MKIENLFNDIDELAAKREHLGTSREGYGGGYNQALEDLKSDIKEYLKGYVDEILEKLNQIVS